MPVIVTSILGLLQYAPQAITEITAVYNAVKSDLSATDQAQIDSALAAAIQADKTATDAADTALTAASQR